jgi:energy-coupling factor transport system permease protein
MKFSLQLAHPAVTFVLFMSVAGMTIISFHPVNIALSLFFSLVSVIIFNGKKGLKLAVFFCVPLMAITVFLNTFFNNNGVTFLFSVGNLQIMLEGLIYGLCSAGAIAATVMWFSCYSAVMSSEKFLYLFGRAAPSAALLVSLTLEQSNLMRQKLKLIDDGQHSLYGDAEKSLAQKLRLALNKVTVLLSWVMEDSIITADAMNARGFGTGKMTKMRPYIWRFADKTFFITLFVFITLCVASFFKGTIRFDFFPLLDELKPAAAEIVTYIIFFVFYSLPLLAELKEALKWRSYQSKI